MIPWIELLLYIGVIFAPDEAYQITFDIENKTHTFNRQDNRAVWYPISDNSEEWSVTKDTLNKNVHGMKTPYFFPLKRESALKAFESGSIFEIDSGFTLTREASGILVIFDLGISLEKYQIKWKTKKL